MSTVIKQTIHLAMAAIMKDISAIQKDRNNTAQNFKFRSIDDMYNAFHDIMAAHGVVCLPEVISVLPSVQQREGKTPTYCRILMVKFRFTASDGSVCECVTAGEGMDQGDKATAKAMSAAHKYALIQTFLTPTEDMPDGDYDSTVDPHEELKLIEAERQEKLLAEKRAALQAQSQANTPLPTAEDNPPELPKTQKQETIERVTKSKKGAKKAEEAQSPAPAPKRSTAGAQEQEQAPEEEDQIPGLEESTPAPNGSKAPPWFDHVIAALSHPDYKGRKVGDLSLEELEYLEGAWSSKPDYQDGIAATPSKAELRKHLRAALADRRG